MAKHWIIAPPSPDCEPLARRLGVPPVVAQLLINREVGLDGVAGRFLFPQLRDLHPPEELPGATLAAERIHQAVVERRKIVLYGDYDVDGITGVAILWHVLRAAGADVTFYVPHRIEEGYGVNLEAVRKLIADGAGMIVTVDCGITAIEAAAVLRQANVPFIVTDHHTPHAQVPDADAIVHPGVGGQYANPHISGAGVAFKVAWAVAQRVSGAEKVAAEYRELLKELLPLAAVGTIADVVPLIGENRIIARHGLTALPSTALAGLRCLIERAGLTGDKITGYDVGFKLAPRINAAGRMGHARLAVELFTRADTDRAREIAMYLEEHNRSRQATERQIVKQAFEMIDRDNLAGDARRAIVLALDGWHAGVIGIVAARVVARYNRPTVMIALSNGEGQGSARSVRHFDLAEALCGCGEHLVAHGGHAMAAGLRIASDRVAPFTEAFVALANAHLTGDDLLPKLRLDAEVSFRELTLPTAEAITGLGPFGMGNPRPKLATDWVELAGEPRAVGGGQEHLQTTFQQNGVRMKCIAFGLASHLEDLKQHRRCRVAFEPLINDYNGRRTVELQVLDFQFPAS